MGLESKITKFLGITALAGSLLFGCSKEDSKVNSVPQNIAPKKIEYKEFEKYFPIHTGNEWKYEIVIRQGGQYFEFDRLRKPIDDHFELSSSRRVPSKGYTPGTYALHFKVGKKVNEQGNYAKFNDGWELQILQDDLGLYDNIEKSFLLRFQEKNRDVIQLNVHDKDNYEEDVDLKFFYNPKKDTEKAIAFEGQHLRFDQFNTNVKLSDHDYKNCHIAIKGIPPSDMPGTQQFLPSRGWKEILIFAPNIGLIRQVQLDYEEKTVSEMNLVNYKIISK